MLINRCYYQVVIVAFNVELHVSKGQTNVF